MSTHQLNNMNKSKQYKRNEWIMFVLIIVGGTVQPVLADYSETFTAQNSTLTPAFSFVAGGANFGYSYFVNLSTLSVNITDYNTNTSCSDPYTCVNSSGVIGWWHFDDASGANVHDSSAQGNDGTWTGNNTINFTTGKYNNGGNFTTSNASYVIVGDKPVYDFGTNEFSVFVVTINSTDGATIVSKMTTGFNGWSLKYTGGKIEFFGGDGVGGTTIGTTNTNYQNSNIHFAMAGRTGNSWFLETDTEQRVTKPLTFAGALASAGNKLIIGHRDVSTDANKTTVYDEVIIFNRVVSSEEFKNMTHTKLKSLQVNATGNGTNSAVWNGATDNSLTIPVNVTNKITGLKYTLPSTMVLNGITVYGYRNSTNWNLTANTTLFWNTIDWANNSYRNSNYTIITSNGEPIENAVATLQYGIVKGNNISFLFYLAVDHSIYGISYNHTTKTYSSPTFIAYSRTDNHGYASPIIDSQGYIHLLYGGHITGDPIFHINSTKPYNISSWTTSTQAVTCTDASLINCEYPSVVINKTGTIWAIYKTTGDGHPTNGINMTVSTDGGATWSTPTKLVNSSTVVQCSPCTYPTWWTYHGGLGIGNNGNISFLFNFYNLSVSPAQRQNMSFMKHNFSQADSVWRMGNDTQYVLPANETYIEDLNPGINAYPGNTFIDTNGNTWIIWHNITTHKLIVKYLNSSGTWNDASPTVTNVTLSDTRDVTAQILVVNGTIYIYTALTNPQNTNYQDIKLLTSTNNGTTYTIRTLVNNISLATQRTTFTSSLLYPDGAFDVAWSNNGSIYFTSFNEKVRSEARTTNIYLNINNSIQPSGAVSYDVDNTSALTSVNLNTMPSYSTVSVIPQTWNTGGDYRKTFTASSDTHINPTTFVIGDFPANSNIRVNKNGVFDNYYVSNSSGYITFTHSTYSDLTIEAFLVPSSIEVTTCPGVNSDINAAFGLIGVLLIVFAAGMLISGIRSMNYPFMIVGIGAAITGAIMIIVGYFITITISNGVGCLG